MEYKINLISNGLVLLTVFCFGLWESYFKEKGKNFATKEDIGDITKEVEDVKQFFNESLEKFKHELNLSTQIRFSLKSAEIEALLNLYDKYFVWKNTLQAYSAPFFKDPFTNDIIQIINKSYLDFLIAESKAELFIRNLEILKIKSELKLATLVLESRTLSFQTQAEYSIFCYNQLEDIKDAKEKILKYKELSKEYLTKIEEFNKDKLDDITRIVEVSEKFKDQLLKELKDLIE